MVLTQQVKLADHMALLLLHCLGITNSETITLPQPPAQTCCRTKKRRLFVLQEANPAILHFQFNTALIEFIA